MYVYELIDEKTGEIYIKCSSKWRANYEGKWLFDNHGIKTIVKSYALDDRQGLLRKRFNRKI